MTSSPVPEYKCRKIPLPHGISIDILICSWFFSRQSFINVLSILLLNFIWKQLGYKLSNFERHRTEGSLKTHRTFKVRTHQPDLLSVGLLLCFFSFTCLVDVINMYWNLHGATFFRCPCLRISFSFLFLHSPFTCTAVLFQADEYRSRIWCKEIWSCLSSCWSRKPVLFHHYYRYSFAESLGNVYASHHCFHQVLPDEKENRPTSRPREIGVLDWSSTYRGLDFRKEIFAISLSSCSTF